MLHCSFCRKSEDQVAQLVAGPNVYICDECVAIAARLMQERPNFLKRLWSRITATIIKRAVQVSVRHSAHAGL
jgi:ATP-dependent protease Clp ATPase subunit